MDFSCRHKPIREIYSRSYLFSIWCQSHAWSNSEKTHARVQEQNSCSAEQISNLMNILPSLAAQQMKIPSSWRLAQNAALASKRWWKDASGRQGSRLKGTHAWISHWAWCFQRSKWASCWFRASWNGHCIYVFFFLGGEILKTSVATRWLFEFQTPLFGRNCPRKKLNNNKPMALGHIGLGTTKFSPHHIALKRTKRLQM